MSSGLKRKRQSAYTEEALNQAIEDVKSGATFYRTCRKYKIPRTTLHARVTNKCTGRLGKKPALSDKEEADLAAWIERMCSIGCSVSRNQIGDSISLSLKTSNKTNPFKSKRPSHHWFNRFVRQYNLLEKVRETRRRLFKGLGVDGTIKWFENLNAHLGKGNLHGLSRTRTYSIGEVSLPMHLKNNWCAKTGPTVLITANAAGHVVPPMIVFDSNDDSNKTDVVKLPRGWSVEANANADMSAELLYNYVKNHFHPWLTRNRIQLPIVLFMYQELAACLTEVLCDFCEKHKILLAVLPPSPHQATTPIEITLFPILRREYMRHLNIFIKRKRILSIGKDDFIGRLEETLDCTDSKNNLERGFYKCGLYPLSAERHVSACIKMKPEEDIENIFQSEKQSDESPIVDESSSVLKCIESNLDPATIESFRSAVDNPTWTGKVEDTNLFYLWRNLVKNVTFGTVDESYDESSELQSSNLNNNENQENEMPSDHTLDPKFYTQDKHKPLGYNYINSKSLDENVSIIVVHPNTCIEESDSDEDYQILPNT